MTSQNQRRERARRSRRKRPSTGQGEDMRGLAQGVVRRKSETPCWEHPFHKQFLGQSPSVDGGCPGGSTRDLHRKRTRWSANRGGSVWVWEGRTFPTALPWAGRGVPRWGGSVWGRTVWFGASPPAHRRCISLANPRQRRGETVPNYFPDLQGRLKRLFPPRRRPIPQPRSGKRLRKTNPLRHLLSRSGLRNPL